MTPDTCDHVWHETTVINDPFQHWACTMCGETKAGDGYRRALPLVPLSDADAWEMYPGAAADAMRPCGPGCLCGGETDDDNPPIEIMDGTRLVILVCDDRGAPLHMVPCRIVGITRAEEGIEGGGDTLHFTVELPRD